MWGSRRWVGGRMRGVEGDGRREIDGKEMGVGEGRRWIWERNEVDGGRKEMDEGVGWGRRWMRGKEGSGLGGRREMDEEGGKWMREGKSGHMDLK